jgi:phospholipid/cholesterol/gamma-HCH transport system ATP-binding protein
VTDEQKRVASQDDEPLIRMVDVWKNFDSLQVLQGINIRVRKGETFVIMGESGTGKSVILKHMIGLLKPDKGHVYFGDAEVSTMGDEELAKLRERFGMVFQGAALFDSMTVAENVAFGLRRHTDSSEDKIRGIVSEKLRLVGLSGVEEKMPAELSGGMKKRVGIARAIAMDPEVILYDEPTAGLDPIMSDVIAELILRVQKNTRATSVVVTHDLTSAYKIATEIGMLKDGVLIETGTAEQIRNTKNPVVSQFIHGEARDRIEEMMR